MTENDPYEDILYESYECRSGPCPICNGRKMTEWIKCSERLPNVDSEREIIIYNKFCLTTERVYDHRYYQCNCKEFGALGLRYSFNHSSTWWLELPEPPND